MNRRNWPINIVENYMLPFLHPPIHMTFRGINSIKLSNWIWIHIEINKRQKSANSCPKHKLCIKMDKRAMMEGIIAVANMNEWMAQLEENSLPRRHVSLNRTQKNIRRYNLHSIWSFIPTTPLLCPFFWHYKDWPHACHSRQKTSRRLLAKSIPHTFAPFFVGPFLLPHPLLIKWPNGGNKHWHKMGSLFLELAHNPFPRYISSKRHYFASNNIISVPIPSVFPIFDWSSIWIFFHQNWALPNFLLFSI